jgi:hypothetical protein
MSSTNNLKNISPKINQKKEFLKIFTEIEFNATEDTLFERMTLSRLRIYSDVFFGTKLYQEHLDNCERLRMFLDKGHTEKEWRIKVRCKRFKMIEGLK